MKKYSPFPTSGYSGPENYCDREAETQKIINLIRGGQSITLYSIRRMGKSSLIKHVEHTLGKEWLCIYIDIYKTSNFKELLEELSTAIIRTVEENSGLGKKIWKLIRSIRPNISFNELNGLPTISFDVQDSQVKQNLMTIMQGLESLDLPVLIAIDEFQQIVKYEEPNVDAWLRSIIQELNNVVFIFSGSQFTIMNELFTHPQRPFFSSTGFMRLGKIDKEVYKNFILEKFKPSKIHIEEDAVEEMLDWTNVHTYYVQVICNRVYHGPIKKFSSLGWKVEAIKVLEELQHTYYNFKNLLSKGQWDLLLGIAMEEKVYAPTASDFLREYELKSSASVIRALEALLEKEMIYFDFDEEGNKYYSIVDLFLMRWIQNNF